jgi:hypothetical protein
MEQELIASKNFQLLSYNIYKVLSLERDHRVEKGRLFLDEIYNEYIKLIENSNLIKNKKLKDALAEIPKLYILSSKNTTPKNEENNFGLELHQLGENNV